jgi:choline-glycine betaine transporter
MIYEENKSLGILTIITGVSTLMDATGNMTGVQVLSLIGLNVYILLGIIWPIVTGISLIKKTINSRSGQFINKRTPLQAGQYEKS